MASWFVHLRIADILADDFDVDLTEFVIGNLAPDSGEILKDSKYQPPSNVTHWKTDQENRLIQPDNFYKTYLTSCKKDSRSFYLGYYSHLITDYFWHEELIKLYKENNWERHNNRHSIYSWNYNVDMIFLRQHPKMRAYNILKNISDFKNTYLDYFSQDAIIKKIKDIYMVYNTDYTPTEENEYLNSETIHYKEKNSCLQ